jgi:hypothetical protein
MRLPEVCPVAGCELGVEFDVADFCWLASDCATATADKHANPTIKILLFIWIPFCFSQTAP